jgi:hypothetical protein
VNCCCCEKEIPVDLLVPSVVQIFRKTAFQNFPTAGCTSGPTEIYQVHVERNRSVFILAAARFELFVPAARQRTHSEWQHKISR